MIFDRKQQLNWYNYPFYVCLIKERLVGQIRTGGGCMRVGESVSNTLKGGGTEMGQGEAKILKRGQAGSKGPCLKKGGAGTPLQTMLQKN